MVRQRPADFIPRMLQAAGRVFARHGLKAARMADIAREMGVAHGSLYNYVESKEALFLFLVDRWGREEIDVSGQKLPLQTPPMQNIVERLEERVAETFSLRALDAALQRRSPNDPEAELREIVLELYAVTERSRDGATILERSAKDVPELFGLFFERVRRELFERITAYVARRVTDGSLQAADPQTAARFIIETVTFFARHRFLDPRPQDLDDNEVRATIVDLVTRSLLPRAEDSVARKTLPRRTKRRK